jgi:hypothetical protein
LGESYYLPSAVEAIVRNMIADFLLGPDLVWYPPPAAAQVDFVARIVSGRFMLYSSRIG